MVKSRKNVTSIDEILKLKPQVQKIFINAGILKTESEEEWNRFCTWKVITTFMEEVIKSNNSAKQEDDDNESSDTE